MKMQKDRNNQNGMQNVYITVSNALDQSDKTRIEVARDLTVAQAVRQEGLAPAGAFDIFDASGRVVSDQKASQLADENVYVGVQKVAGGGEFERVGLTEAELNELRVLYPSIQAVKHLKMGNGRIGGFILNLRGVTSHTDPTERFYRLVIDARGFPLQKPNAFVLSPCDEDIEHCNIYHSNTFSLLPNMEICAICDGSPAKEAFESWSKNRAFRIRAWLNHIQSVLSNPNPDDRARNI
jgi:hypothetical protein